MARDRLDGIVIRHGESSRDSQAREGRECHGNLIGIQFRTSQLSPLGETLINPYCRRSNELGENPPKAHIELDQDEVANATRVRRAGSRLEHVPAILRMEHRRNEPEGTKLNPGSEN